MGWRAGLPSSLLQLSQLGKKHSTYISRQSQRLLRPENVEPSGGRTISKSLKIKFRLSRAENFGSEIHFFSNSRGIRKIPLVFIESKFIEVDI